MSDNRHPSRDAEPVILCIDDDPDISETIALRLRKHRAKVLRAFHGMHGLSLATTRRPDLIITDLRMPQGGGSYIIERLRNHADTCRLPIIVLTGQRHVDPNAMARRLRVDQVLTKPIHFDDLAAAISKVVPLIAKRRFVGHSAPSTASSERSLVDERARKLTLYPCPRHYEADESLAVIGSPIRESAL